MLKARCDGKPIEWAAPTHGPGRARPWRTAAECIDWSLPCPSIFLTREEGRAIGVKRPLAEATLRRIARGVMRYVIEAAEPFIVPAAAAPLAPFVSYAQQGGGNRDPRNPLHTVTASPKDQNCIVAATLINTRNGEREGQAPRVRDIAEPMATITAQGSQGALVAAFLAQYNNDQRGPHPGHDLRDPLSTIAAKGPHQGVVAAHLMSLKGSDRRDQPADAPAPAITAGGYHVAEVRAFLIKYYGTDQDPRLNEPLGTVTTKDRFGLVIVTIGGVEYAIVDIGMRMLTPRELAAAQGFPAGYVLDPLVNGRPLTKTAQVRMIGNSVSPPMAEAEIRAVAGPADEAVEAA
nr:DNA cytosine methyltransferase [Sphingosinicella ginsenosidimutans]